VVVATFILGWLSPGLLQDGVSDTWTSIAIGVLLLGSLTVKGITDRRQGRSMRESVRVRFAGARRPRLTQHETHQLVLPINEGVSGGNMLRVIHRWSVRRRLAVASGSLVTVLALAGGLVLGTASSATATSSCIKLALEFKLQGLPVFEANQTE